MTTKRFDEVVVVGAPELGKLFRNTGRYVGRRVIKVAGHYVRPSSVEVLGTFFHRTAKAFVHVRGWEVAE